MLIHDKFYCEGNDSFDKFSNITDILSKRQNVEFALYCAKDVFHLVKEEHKEKAKCCIDLIEKWLIDENSVTSEELKNASNVDFYSWSTAWHSAYDAFNAFRSVSSNTAVYATANAYYSWQDPNNKLNEYLIVANSYLTKTTTNCPNYEIEGKILYLIDELEENIIVHKDKYYVNMNGIENCPEYGFDTQQELLNELLYSEDRFWEFVRNWLDNLYKEEKRC